jgi:NADPH:quinone reductase-like Zn-dependent oxidoreductase
MRTMLAARLHDIGKPMQLEQVAVPEPRPTDVVVQVEACNIVPNLSNVLATYAQVGTPGTG